MEQILSNNSAGILIKAALIKIPHPGAHVKMPLRSLCASVTSALNCSYCTLLGTAVFLIKTEDEGLLMLNELYYLNGA